MVQSSFGYKGLELSFKFHQEAAEITAFNLKYHYNNFPCAAGPEQISSSLAEDENSNFICFIYNDTSLVSLGEVVNDKGGLA